MEDDWGVWPFADVRSMDRDLAGSKAASLSRAMNAGLPAPDGIVISTDAFRAHTQPLEADISRLASAEAGELSARCASIRDAILVIELDRDLVGALRTRLGGIEAPAYAVRSSATAEDLQGASFAGQYASFLNVPPAEIPRRILDVWASVYSQHAVAYRRMRGIDEDDVAMAVLILPMLDAAAAGVMFTCDPASGDDDRFVVNCALGLGEGVVAGSVPSDRFVLDAATGHVVARAIAFKDKAVRPADGRGVGRVEVAAGGRTDPALSTDELRELWDAGRRITEVFGPKQDVEFCVEDGRVVVLQVRPATAVGQPTPFPVSFPDPADAEHTWFRASRGPEPVLLADLSDAYAEAMKRCFQTSGSPMARNWIQLRVHGHRFARPGGTDEEMAGYRSAFEERHADIAGDWIRLYNEHIEPEVLELLEEIKRFRPTQRTSLRRLVEHLERTTWIWAHVMGDLHWRMVGFGGGFDWPSTFAEITGEPPVASSTLLQSIPNMTTRLVRWLRRLARIVQSDTQLAAAFAARDYDAVVALSSDAGLSFRASFRRMMREYGLRTGQGFGSSAGTGAPTWNMRPEIPLDMVAAYVEQDLDAIDAVERRAGERRRRAAAAFRKRLARDPERLAKFDAAYATAVGGVVRMENHNHLMDQSMAGGVREAIHHVGVRLVHRGLLDDPDDVLHVSTAELRAVADGDQQDLRALTEARRTELARQGTLRPPATIGADPPARSEGGGPPGTPTPEAKRGVHDGVLYGEAASSGRAAGPARVVLPTPHPPRISRGDVLVARNCGPEWTPIFPLLGALVLDEGAGFQHAALVAREYGIPCVLQTREATTTIREGQVVEVDGDAGTVSVR